MIHVSNKYQVTLFFITELKWRILIQSNKSWKMSIIESAYILRMVSDHQAHVAMLKPKTDILWLHDDVHFQCQREKL